MSTLPEPTAQGVPTHGQDPRGLLQRPPLLQQRHRGSQIELHPRPPTVLPGRLRPSHPGDHPLAHHLAFELSKRPENLKHEPPRRRRRVDPGIPHGREPDAPAGEVIQHAEQVLERPAQPVQLPHQHHIEPAALGIGEQAIEGFTVNQDNIEAALYRNPVLVTALNPVIGYAKAAEIAKTAYKENKPVIDVAEAMTDIPRGELESLLDPKKLTTP